MTAPVPSAGERSPTEVTTTNSGRGGGGSRGGGGGWGGGDRWAGLAVEYGRIERIHGPLLVVRDTRGIGWDESAVVRLDDGSGREARHGVVLEVDRGLAVVQVLEGTDAIDPSTTRVRFTGRPAEVSVGTAWLGRTCNGRGEPLDGGPPITSGTSVAVTGKPLNPVWRESPSDPVLTGISAIDALTTIVRGQKLPIFSEAGLPHLALAAQVASQARAGSHPFCVVFAGMGLTHADAATVRDALEERLAAGELVLLLNTADDPVIERILTPRIALTVAEHLAFETDRDVLVVLADMTSYAEALREISSARGELPGRRAYPGYLYSDLATLYERCGRVRGRAGSVTIVPVLTMPAGDITHPVPDLTGYITEGQVVLSPVVHSHGVYPPVDALSSLSRLMRHGAGPGRTREDHLDLAAQLLAALARAREVAELSEIVGVSALSQTDQLYLSFADEFERQLLDQRPHEHRTLDETLDRCWNLAALLPRRELTMLPDHLVEEHLAAHREHPEHPADELPGPRE